MENTTHCRLSPYGLAIKTLAFLLVILSFFSIHLNAQVFWTEDWTTGGIGWTNNVSTGAEGADPNFFTVSDNEGGGITPNLGAPTSCGLASNGNNTLHVTSVFFPTGGAAYDAGGLCGLLFCPETNRRSESPTINCTGKTTISVNFNYIEGGQTTFDDATFYYFDGAVWTFLDNMPKTLTGCGGQGLWTSRTVALPVSADNNPLVKIAFRWVNNDDGVGTDPSFAVDDVTLSTVSSLNTITTGTITGSPFCACSSVNVPFTSTGTFTAGNTYTAQLSNAVGSFATPTTIGTLLSVANTGTIACTIPCATPTGTAYRIRVISSTPAVIGSDNGVNITINAVVVPSVTIAAVPSGAICAGTSVTFTATPTNGGTTPGYQWQINGTNVGGATSATFTSTTLANGDVVTVVMTSTASCASPVTATSAGITMTVNPTVVPSVLITSTGATICAGDPVTFTAAPTNGGTTPTYQWQVNGTNVGGATSSTFTSSTLVNGDAVTVIMTSNALCASPVSATSNTITIIVSAAVPASVSITSTGATICAGDAVTFTAAPTNGGTTPTYQWQVNGTNVGGATSATFTSSSLVNGDVITVIMTSSLTCATGSPATSNTITIIVSSAVPASVSIAVIPGTTICSGDLATFTATPTNGGATPTYQWQVNGTNVGGATAATFASTTLANGDVVTVIMTSSLSCATGSPATSNTITMVVNTSVTASVTIVGAPTTICAGNPVTFTATPTNGGTPSYQWQVNGVNAGTNAATFTSSALSNGDVVTVVMTSSSPCVTGSPATSNSVVITVNTCAPPVANFSADQTIFCTTPACVNFTDLSTNSPTSWSWSFPGATPATSTSQNPTNICYAADGSYDVTLIATNADGSDTLTQVGYITVGAPIPVTITGNLLISACEETTLYASPSDGTYVWGPGGSSSGAQITVSPSVTTDYYVTYTSPGGCTDSDTVTVVVQNIFSYYMPTGFSPNGDGINDAIQVHGRGIDYINLRIFDRIGEKVFETSDPETAWDGKLIGLRMNDNVFVYTLEVTFCNGDTAKENGSIMLAR